jgi:hypothetical protein
MSIAGRLIVIAVVIVLLGCDDNKSVPRYELRWCTNGESNCLLTQNEGAYVKGGYFYTLDQCHDAIKHLAFYGNKLGCQCIEITNWERDMDIKKAL